MDVEFHYYITYLIAARAGFSPEQAWLIAFSAQQVDDNCDEYEIHGSTGSVYKNYISQTMNIERPRSDLLRIYPLFHFVPGDTNTESARRKDGKTSPWMTTPNNLLAQEMMKNALQSGSLYRIGIAAHAFADTWAHQNFIGKCDELNKYPPGIDFWHQVKPFLWNLINTGHGAFAHTPDKPALIWKDKRLANDTVDNRARFLDAAEALYRIFALHKNPALSKECLEENIRVLKDDLDKDIGEPDPDSSDDLMENRIERYRESAKQLSCGGEELPEYSKDQWFNEAVECDFIHNQRVYRWSDNDNFHKKDWLKFVEAVKEHQSIFWPRLKEKALPGIEREEM